MTAVGRPPILSKDRKDRITGLRLNHHERSLLERAAKHQDQKLSDWMRTTLVKAANLELSP